jgi:shikimate kinase/3-dehydroquinate synthase
MRIFLSGMMGTGKSTVARIVSRRLGLSAIDLDERIALRTASTVPEVFVTRGEAAFRALEQQVLDECLSESDDVVVSLGGGTVTSEPLRRRLLGQGVLVTLEADVATLNGRLGSGSGRPLLQGQDVAQRLSELLVIRASAYAECHGRIDTSHRTPEEVADDVIRLAQERPVVVPLGLRTYTVEIGAGVRSRLAARVAGRSGLLLVTDSEVGPLWGSAQRDRVQEQRGTVAYLELEPGEAAKHVDSVTRIWDAALEAGLDRSSMLVGVGGGVVGDLTGFAAATLLRGVAVGHLPTTLLAMVDSSVGGKTGFDTRHGKNLVGAFHQPSFVLCDVDTLSTLPRAERVAGLAEVVKAAWIDGEAAVAQLEADAEALAAGDTPATVRAIRMALELKARVVTADEREGGQRAVLNLGHTVGHAIEARAAYQGIRHGEAVALGMLAAMTLAVELGRGSEAQRERLERLLQRLGLPTHVGPHLTEPTLDYIGSDKKRRADMIVYVLPAEPGQVVLESLPLAKVRALLGAHAV